VIILDPRYNDYLDAEAPETIHPGVRARYVAAYSFCSRDLTRYAASGEAQGDSFSFVLEYEFENQILAALGCSLRWR
jgi:hypothetical protein